MAMLMQLVNRILRAFSESLYARDGSDRACVDEDLDASESLDRYGDELAAVVHEDWTHRILNPRALIPTVGANIDGINRRRKHETIYTWASSMWFKT